MYFVSNQIVFESNQHWIKIESDEKLFATSELKVESNQDQFDLTALLLTHPPWAQHMHNTKSAPCGKRGSCSRQTLRQKSNRCKLCTWEDRLLRRSAQHSRSGPKSRSTCCPWANCDTCGTWSSVGANSQFDLLLHSITQSSQILRWNI